MDYAWGMAFIIGIPMFCIFVCLMIWAADKSKEECEEWEHKKAQIWREELERKEEEYND